MRTKDERHRIQYIAGMFLLAAIVIFMLTVFSMLRKPRLTEEYLMDTKSHSYGWSYEILQDGSAVRTEPAFLEEYSMYFPDMEPEAVKITRILTEEIPSAELKLQPYDAGVEVFLGDRLLYSDFQTDERDAAGFLILKEQDLHIIRPEFRKIDFLLPSDYVGKELTVITYFREGGAENVPVFPFLTCEQAEWAMASTETVLPVAVMTLCAVFAVTLSILFVLDLSNGKPDYSIFFLVLFFLLLFLEKTYMSLPGSYSILTEHLNLSFLTELYMAPLYFYLALHLRGKRLKYILCGCTVLWTLYEAIFSYQKQYGYVSVWYDQSKLTAFLMFLLLLAAMGSEHFRQKKEERQSFSWSWAALLCAAVFSTILLYAEEWEGDVVFYIAELGRNLEYGNCSPLVSFLSGVASVMAVLVLVLEFMERTYQSQILVRVLEERSQYAMENYERMLAAEEATHAARHEMRHHMIVLRELFRSQDAERIDRYLDTLESELDQLPVMKYSKNMLVNVIAGTYLDQAKELGIRVQHQFLVPENLDMADEDLCVFLSNMLENALNACRRIDPDRERFIRVVMHMEGNFLYIGCTNSVSDEKTEEIPDRKIKEDRRHGYGLAAMRRIAEKYGSVLKVDRSPSIFSVKSNLCLNGRTD